MTHREITETQRETDRQRDTERELYITHRVQ